MIRNELWLPVFVLLTLTLGLVVLRSAVPSVELFTRQLAYLGVGVVVCAALYWLGAQRVFRLAWPAYLAVLGLLVLTRFFGVEAFGARRWLELGPVQFQPSELAKLSLILVLAVTLARHPVHKLLDYVRLGVLAGIPFMLVFLEPDLGTALVLAAIAAGMALVRGIPWKHLLVFGVLLAVALPTVVWPNLAPHQRTRIMIFMNPSADPQGSGYQVIQSRIAIGSGGLWGKGYMQGTQSQLGFIPFVHTDFIFPVLAEEWGFVGALTLILLYALIFWRLTVMALECPKPRDRLVLSGVLSLLGFQVLVNIGVTLGLAPVTGITLPLVSYGGTSLISTLLALTLAYVVHRDRYQEW